MHVPEENIYEVIFKEEASLKNVQSLPFPTIYTKLSLFVFQAYLHIYYNALLLTEEINRIKVLGRL